MRRRQTWSNPGTQSLRSRDKRDGWVTERVMNDSISPLVLLLLGLATLCLAAITLTVIVTAAQLRATLRRLDALLPDAGQVLSELKRSGRHMRRLLTRTDAVGEQIERVVGGAVAMASHVIERVGGKFGQRAGAEPRSHHRNGKGS